MKKLLIASMIVGLTGCSSPQTVEDAKSFASCTFPDAPTVQAPDWICDVMPVDIGAGAKGYAKKSAAGMSTMRMIAVNDARVALASEFEINVNNMFKQAVESTVTTSDNIVSEDVQETFASVTKNVVTRTLTNSKIIVSQVSPAGGLYVLVGMDKEAYQANLNTVVDEVTSKDSELWSKFNSDKAAEDLTNTLKSLTES